MTSSPSLHRRALAGLLLANAFWGLSFPLIKGVVQLHAQMLPGSGNWFVTAMTVGPRFLLAAAFLAVVAPRAVLGVNAAEWRQGAGLGICNALGMLFQVDGLQFTAASVSAFLTQFSAIMIPVIVALRSRRSPGPVVWCCACLVLAGVAILGRFDLHALRFGRGELETLLSSVFFTAQIFLLGAARYAGNRVLPVSAVMFASVGGFFAVLALATAAQPTDCLVPWHSGPWLTFTGLLTALCTLGAFLLMNRWQPLVTATEAGLIYCFESVFASVLALFLPALLSRWAGFDYPNETVTWQLLAGGGLITAANLWLQAQPRRAG